ncbi:MAG TPA: type II toxin-antitoxin system Phd/YefM family antitoxin [Candidatus Baltobacteraceae bacterium]|nr:type II toxin-antitoxin system Phd/YefM family antitoxin [Candidatus Baltobacteraceae bacterium]
MKIAPLSEVKAKLSAYLDSSENEGPVIITRNGKAVAVLIAPKNEDDLETLVLSRSPRFLARIERARRSIRQGKGLSETELWRAVEKSPRDHGEYIATQAKQARKGALKKGLQRAPRRKALPGDKL